MSGNFKNISDLDNVLEEGKNGTVLILKHSATCGISAFAHEQVAEYLKGGGRDAYLVVVQAQRDISDALAQKLKVRHESPQLLVLNPGGVSVLNHYDITQENIKSLLA